MSDETTKLKSSEEIKRDKELKEKIIQEFMKEVRKNPECIPDMMAMLREH